MARYRVVFVRTGTAEVEASSLREALENSVAEISDDDIEWDEWYEATDAEVIEEDK